MLSHYPVHQLYGKSIKDKRGGSNNIHSWDIDYKGVISADEKNLLNQILKERRKKKWAKLYGIQWMDGMPLTIDFIRTFYTNPDLEQMLEHLVGLKYLRKEHPKRLINNRRVQDENLPAGYNIVAGKMSFEVGKVLDPNGIAPTLVAMDMQHLYVVDGLGIRPLSLREGLRLFGYPNNYWAINLQIKENVVHKIRPGVWYSARQSSYPMFKCLEDFISAIEQTVWQNPETRKNSGTWKTKFIESYEKHYGVKLSIPRWDDIQAYYKKDNQ